MPSSGVSTRFVINTALVLFMLTFNLYKLNLVETIQDKREACYQSVVHSMFSDSQWAGMSLDNLTQALREKGGHGDSVQILQTKKEECDRNNTYPAFPWQQHPQSVKTDLNILWWHILTAVILYILSYIHTLDPSVPILEALFYCAHIVFTAIVIPNLTHLGDFSPIMATIILVTLLGALQLTLLFGPRDCHLWTLSIVVMGEVGFWAWTMLL